MEQITRFFVLITLFWNYFSYASNCSVSEDEFNGLQALYYATNGEVWDCPGYRLSPWEFPSTLSTPCYDPWYGLTCELIANTDMCQIVRLSLSDCKMEGHIPDQIGLLSNLQLFELINGNFESSTIPSEIGLMTNLTVLQLSADLLSGTIPIEIWQLTTLSQLSLDGNYLQGSLPTDIGMLSNLRSLILYLNNFTSSLPDELYTLGKLSLLELSSNNFEGSLSPSIGALSNLIELQFDSNGFTGPIPSQIGMLTHLSFLVLMYNGFTGTIPLQLFDCTAMRTLSLEQLPLQGTISTHIGNLVLLETLAIIECGLSGTLPTELGRLTSVRTFTLSYNSFTGSIPAELGQLTSMTTFSVCVNQLQGPLPASLCSIPAMEVFYVFQNQLTGSIPTEIGIMSKLSQVTLYSNRLTGTIPTQLVNLPEPQGINLASNCLSGTIPTELFNSSRIFQWMLNDNMLTGPLPPNISKSFGLEELCVGSNLLSSSIPISWQQSHDVAMMWLDLNYLTSTVPLLDYPGLNELLLYNNFFSGTWDENVFFPALNFFLASTNMFSGNLPTFGTLAEIEIYDVHDNYFNGSIPEVLFLADELTTLNLGSNSITGRLPFDLISSPNIEILIISSNYFNGSINDISFGHNLTALDISNNSLTGTFPNTIGHAMELLSVESNHLTGPIETDCHSAKHIGNLLIGSNNFVGNLSELSCFSNLTVLSAESCQFTGSLSFLASLYNLEQVLLFNNSLTGTLPLFLGEMTHLKVLLLANNKFVGTVGGIFNSANQTLLTVIDISSNDFTGNIPADVFQLPSLQSFAAMKSCFSGSLPPSICNATSLQALLLDGVTSGLPCQHRFNIIHTSDAYISTKGPLQGGIPDCLWSLPQLRSLHLSSNGLTGTILGPGLASSSNLTSIVLSYNQLSGTIPLSLQSLAYTTLELSNNRLKGTVSEGLPRGNAVVNLENNRLSGFLPSSYGNGSEVNVMRGNLFNCDANHPKPSDSADTDAASVPCGSSQLNDSLLVWGVCLVVCAVCIFVALYVANALADVRVALCMQMFVLDALEYLFNCIVKGSKQTVQTARVRSELMASNLQWAHHVKKVLDTMQTSFNFSFAVCILCNVLLCIPLFLLMKLGFDGEYSTHTYQYLWLVSSAFTTGLFPAVVLVLLYLGLVLVFISFVDKVGANDRETMTTVDNDIKSQSADVRQSNWTSLFSTVVILLHIGVMSVVNVLYLFVLLSGSFSTSVVAAVQVAVSVFKVLWDGFVTPFALNCVFGGVSQRPDSDAGSSYAMVKFICSMCSSVLLPCLVSLAANSLCFLDLFIPQSVVTETFFINLASNEPCININLPPPNISNSELLDGQVPSVPSTVKECVSFASDGQLTTDFYPPFAYSFQCGSGILTSYIPVLLYGLAFRLLLVAFRLLAFIVKKHIRGATTPLSLGTDIAKLINRGIVLGSLMVDCLLLLTFGLASPAVAVLLTACVLVELSWYFAHVLCVVNATAAGETTAPSIPEWVDRCCQSLHLIPLRSVWYCVHVSSAFWALMIFDIIADQNVHNLVDALWGPVIIVGIPILLHVFWSLRIGFNNQHRRVEDDKRNGEKAVADVSVDDATSWRASSTSIRVLSKIAGEDVANPVLTHHPHKMDNSDFL